MSDDQDLRIADLLNQAAPPPRDPLFRVSVLERREQQRFQRRLYTMLAGAVVILSICILALTFAGSALDRAGAVMAVAALAVGCLSFRGSLRQVLRRVSL